MALATLVLFFSLITAFSLIVMRAHGAEAARALSFSAQNANQRLGLDPNKLEDPASYDTRPCLQHPSDATSSGKYPVSPPHIFSALAVQNRAGVCIDMHSVIVENQVIADTRGHDVGNLQIFWLSTCPSSYRYVSFSFPFNQVTQASIWIKTVSESNFVQWFQNVTDLAPAVHHFQRTGSVAGSDLNLKELYSPLIYAPAAPASASIDIQLADGSEYGNATASYAAGVKQYNGVHLLARCVRQFCERECDHYPCSQLRPARRPTRVAKEPADHAVGTNRVCR